MKISRLSLALLALGSVAFAQDPVPPAVVATAPGSTLRSPQELEQLLAPIALYPDALIAVILPASTVPTDVVLAARHLRENPGDRSQIEHRAWDESVKSLTHYPEVVQWMDENLHWTRQVGEAFAVQPADVMQAVQRLRAKARAAGTLVDTPQQQVIAEPQVIRIVPAQPDVIYVPHYEPDIVFVDRPVYYTRPFLTFGVGVPVGSWLAFDCDWRRNTIWVGNRHRRWSGHDWHRPVVSFAPSPGFGRTPDVRQWRPPQTVRTTVTITQRTSRPEIARPAPFSVASSRWYSHRDSSPNYRRTDFHGPSSTPAPQRSYSPGFRSEGSRSRTNTVDPTPQATPQVNVAPTAPPTLPPLPQTTPNRSYNSGSRSDNFRSRSGGPGNPTPGGSPTVNVAPTPPPQVSPPPDSRRSGRDDDGRRGNFRGPPPHATVSNPQVAPPLPSTVPSRHMSPPAAIPAQRSFSRPAPTGDAAPSQPARTRSAPPAAAPVHVAPPPPAAVTPSTPAQPANPQPHGGESRGHRGSYRRDNS